MNFKLNLATLRERAARRAANVTSPAILLTDQSQPAAPVSKLAALATPAQSSAAPVEPLPTDPRPDSTRTRARAREADRHGPARDAMHRLGYRDGEAEVQLQAVLQTVPVETVAADLHSIADERGSPPVTDPVEQAYTEQLRSRGLLPPVIASLAPRLAQRDRDGVDLRSCAECARFEPIGSSRGVVLFCQHPSPLIKFGCHGPEVLFRCEGFVAFVEHGSGARVPTALGQDRKRT